MTHSAPVPSQMAAQPSTGSLHFPCIVTTMIVRRVRPGKEQAYERWMGAISALAAKFEGYLGTTVLRPAEDRPSYIVILNFTDTAKLEVWMSSTERRAWLKEAEGLTLDDGEIQTLTGLERWFTVPNRAWAQPPPRYKMALLTALGLFPLLLVFQAAFGPLLVGLPHWGRLLFSVGLGVPLMTYAVMPGLTRLLFRWLYPPG